MQPLLKYHLNGYLFVLRDLIRWQIFPTQGDIQHLTAKLFLHKSKCNVGKIHKTNFRQHEGCSYGRF